MESAGAAAGVGLGGEAEGGAVVGEVEGVIGEGGDFVWEPIVAFCECVEVQGFPAWKGLQER